MWVAEEHIADFGVGWRADGVMWHEDLAAHGLNDDRHGGQFIKHEGMHEIVATCTAGIIEPSKIAIVYAHIYGARHHITVVATAQGYL